jgi:5'(3')-deoxyribonucleotidase
MNNVILIDCDGVVADFDGMFIHVLRTQFGIEFNPNDSLEWDYFNHPQVIEVKNDVWQYILSTRHLIRGIQKFSYADEMIRKLREVGSVEACTSIVAGGYYADERIMWLMEQLDFKRIDIHLSYKKWRVHGDVFIDDKPENVAKWADAWYTSGGIPVLWQTPGRASTQLDERILCTGNVDDVLEAMIKAGKVPA